MPRKKKSPRNTKRSPRKSVRKTKRSPRKSVRKTKRSPRYKLGISDVTNVCKKVWNKVTSSYNYMCGNTMESDSYEIQRLAYLTSITPSSRLRDGRKEDEDKAKAKFSDKWKMDYTTYANENKQQIADQMKKVKLDHIKSSKAVARVASDNASMKRK
jgi:hypothetical protein